MKAYRLFPTIAIIAAACGGEAPTPDAPDSAPDAPPAPTAPEAPAAPTGALSLPDWYVIDHDARTVSLTMTAGATPDNNYWNYNGFTSGQVAIVVPEGYSVTIHLVNEDPNMPHSVGILAELSNFMTPPVPNPAFPGAMTANPTSMVDATMPGETETITFVADAAGSYSMVCFIPGHAGVGMWLFFDVSGDGEAGVRGGQP